MNITNKIKRKLTYVLLLLGVMMFLSPTATVLAADSLWNSNSIPGSRQKPLLVDNADLLTDYEEELLIEDLNNASAEHNCNIVVLTVDDYTDYNSDITEFGDHYLDYNGFGADYNGNSVLFFLSMNDRSWGISTAGDAQYAFTDYGQEKLVEKMMSYLKEGEYYDAFDTYISVSRRYLELYAEGTPYDVGNTPRTASETRRIIILSLAIGFVFALIPILVMAAQLKTVHMQTNASGYQAPNGLSMRIHKDTFTHKNITKHARSQDNGSRGGHSGGSSLHISSSGVSHGGSHGHF